MVWLMALLVLASQEGKIHVTAQTKDGNSITGTTATESITVKSSLGDLKMSLDTIMGIFFNKEGVIVTTKKGSSVKGKLLQETWEISSDIGELTLKTADLRSLRFFVRRTTGSIPRKREPPSTTAPKAPPKAPPKPAPVKGLTPIATLSLNAALSGHVPMEDGTGLCALNASDGKVLIVDLENFKVKSSVALTGTETMFALMPDGESVVAAGNKTLTLASLKTGKVTKTFVVEEELLDIYPIDSETIIASSSNHLLTLSIPKRAIVSRAYALSQSRFLGSDGSSRLYTSRGMVLLPTPASGRTKQLLVPVVYSSSSKNMPQRGSTVSPDLRFVISPDGALIRMGRCCEASLVNSRMLPPHFAAAWSPARKTLFLVTGNGFVKEYDTQTWELTKSWVLGFQLTWASVNAKGTELYGYGKPTPPGASSSNWRSHRPRSPVVGDLMKFEIPGEKGTSPDQ